jgi:hypothetical protein
MLANMVNAQDFLSGSNDLGEVFLIIKYEGTAKYGCLKKDH